MSSIIRLFAILLLSVAGFMPTLHAQTQEKSYIFDAYGVNEGLSQSTVYNIIQDDQGFLWIATRDGINRFDGYDFNEYRYNPSVGDELRHGAGDLVHRAANGGRAVINRFDLKGYKQYLFFNNSRHQLLVSHNCGISLYDKYRNSFREVFHDTTNVNETERDFLRKFVILGEDTATRELFIWRPALGLYVLNDSSYSVKKIVMYPRGFTQDHLPESVVKDGTTIWMNRLRGELLAMDTRSARILTYCVPTIGDNTVMRSLNRDSLLIVSEGHITIFNKRLNRYTDLAYNIHNVFNQPFIPQVLEMDHAGNVWIGGNDGVLVYNVAQHAIVQHIVTFNTFENRSLNNVNYLYRDAADNMWVGTDGDGIKKYSPHRKVFNQYRSPYITHNMVKAIYKHDDGRLFVGMMFDGLDIYAPDGHFVERISNETSPGFFPADNLSAMCREDENHIWFHFQRMHIGLFEVNTKKYVDLTNKINELGLPAQHSDWPFVFKRPNGEVYFNDGEYLLKFTEEAGEYKAAIVHQFVHESLTCFFEDYEGNQYAGTKASLYVKDGALGNWRTIPLPSGTVVKSINKNAHKQLLVATNRGLFILDQQYFIQQHYNSFDNPSLVNDFLYGVLLDDKDRVWVSHNKGLSVINTVTNEIYTYTHVDGLQSNEFNTGAYFKSLDGELFFGGIRGVNGFYPKNFKNNPFVPNVIIKSLEVLDRPYDSDTAVSLLKHIELPYNQNTIAIEYVPLEFTNPLKNSMQYMLEGADDDWVEAGTFKMARYTNLRPGNYVFKVRASNNDDIWSGTSTSLEIVIRVPFWQTLWFRFLLLLLLLGIAYYFSTLYLDYKIRHEKLKLEKEQAVDQERARISSDMHDDLGSGLSTIRLLSEIAKRKIHDPSQTKEIERISEAAGELVDKMGEIIWAMNSSNDSLENLIAYMRSFVADFLEHAHIEHAFYIPESIPDIKLSGGTRRNIYLAVKESVNNVMKHAQATEVIIELKIEDSKMTILIRDNGRGFDPEKVRLFGNGLKNIQKRMQAVGGYADISTNKGTTVLLDIPLN
ncbi:Signal transduction histidine kinase [Chitinophaga costaii]|uniref:Signal transduction histidine kinase n=1 Tax=Chitinophaga costaii TaxID=1335309 RepID=A0A1C4CGV4_9BACT|nr:sensor histidine kinase [Chitinophaga costaii]PUZ27092.1 hypothetical protein DCM91_07660 [Chitinophaga costaii]SCC18397.1 Signal transduction histidine kinase [Chitinophaga costaii]